MVVRYATRTFRIEKLVFFLAALISCASVTFGVREVKTNLDEFLVKKWTTEDGLPQNTVTAIVQTKDGYLWLGTFGGLARFDGIRFTTFDATNTPNFKKNRVLSLHDNPRGGLWVGTDSGEVYIVRGNRLEEFISGLEFARKAVWGIAEDPLGNLYISSDAGIEVYSLDEEGWPVPGSGRVLARGQGFELFLDRNGRTWAKYDGDFVLLSSTTITSISSLGYIVPPGLHDLTFDEKGRLFVAASTTLGEAGLDRYREILSLNSVTFRAGPAIAFADGQILFQQANELYVIAGTEITVHDLGDYVRLGSRAIFQDNDGIFWLATQTDGLVRLERKKIGSMASVIGRKLNGVYSVIEDGDGTVWFTGEQLTGFKGGDIRTVSKVADGRPFPVLRSLAVGPDGQLWAGGMLGLYRLDNDELVPVPGFDDRHVQALFFDKRGDLFVGTETGLIIRQGEQLKIPDTTDRQAWEVHFVTQALDGTIWIGTEKGIKRLDGANLGVMDEISDFSDDFVRDIVQSADGAMWLGTYGGGLKRFKDGKVSTLTRSNGLPNNFISRILVADDGKFWILSNNGMFAATRAELDSVADGATNLVGGAVFGKADGMTSSEANGGHQPAGTKTADGRLWFVMIDDLVWIDPNYEIAERPRVLIENATSRKGSEDENFVPIGFDTSTGLEVLDQMRNLQIDYTALSFSKPESIRFVYKLEGLDPDWIDAQGRRSAFYPYLPPGDYQFLVKAISADGVWSEAAGFRIRVAAQFWETRWFASLLFILALCLISFLFWNRLRQLRAGQRRKVEFARQLIVAGETERRRIAADLHDGLTQNLLLIKNWASIAREKAAKDVPQSIEYMDKIGSIASGSIDETRTIIENLGPRTLEHFGLTDAIMNLTDQVQEAFGVVFEKDIENIDGILDRDSELSVYRMTQECINNIIKHSDSPRGHLIIKKDNATLRIQISDFGSGFDPALDKVGSGLRNLEERAELLNGSVTINSRRNEGTTVTITVPHKG